MYSRDNSPQQNKDHPLWFVFISICTDIFIKPICFLANIPLLTYLVYLIFTGGVPSIPISLFLLFYGFACLAGYRMMTLQSQKKLDDYIDHLIETQSFSRWLYKKTVL